MKHLVVFSLFFVFLFSGCSKSRKLADESIFTTHRIITDFEGRQVRLSERNIPLIWSSLMNEGSNDIETFENFRILTDVRKDGSPLVFLVATSITNHVQVGMELIPEGNKYVIGNGKTCACLDSNSPCDLHLSSGECRCAGDSDCIKSESISGIATSSR